MTRLTHNKNKVLEEFGMSSVMVRERRSEETNRLRTLAITIDPVKIFAVERLVYCEPAKTKTFKKEIKRYTIAALNASQAATRANTIKFEEEVKLGYHNKGGTAAEIAEAILF
jgi:hypothetical protein